MSVSSELLTGILISQVTLVRVLDQAGVLRKQDYTDALQAILDRVPAEREGLDRYLPIRLMIEKLNEKPSALQ